MKNLSSALIHLRTDPVLSGLIDKFGRLNYQPARDRFAALVYSIIEQQLSSAAAHTIYARFRHLFPGGKFTPRLILAVSPHRLRGIGTSWAKAGSLHDLSQKVLDRQVDLNRLDRFTDEEVVAHLTQVKGIGPWTAQMYLMFCLHRPDVFSPDDVGIQNAVVSQYRLSRGHKNFKARLDRISRPWRPYRTIACWYLWASLDASR